MKIRDMKGSKGFRTMSKIAVYLTNIINDAEVTEAKKVIRGKDTVISDVLSQAFPALFDRHAEDVLGLIAAYNDKTIEEMEAMSMNDIKELLDGIDVMELMDFLPFAAHLVVHA